MPIEYQHMQVFGEMATVLVPVAARGRTVEMVYTGPTGAKEVCRDAPENSPEALELVGQVLDLQAKHGAACPYSFRYV